MPLGRSSPAKRTPQFDLQHYGGRRPVLPCVEDSVRRPQRPGNQFRAETLSGGTLPAIHPRELPGTVGSAAMLWQGTQDISLRCQHCAPPPTALQAKSRESLCRNCGWQQFLVETRGKLEPRCGVSQKGCTLRAQRQELLTAEVAENPRGEPWPIAWILPARGSSQRTLRLFSAISAAYAFALTTTNTLQRDWALGSLRSCALPSTSSQR